MQDNKEYIQEWLIKGSHDLTTAQLAFKAGAPSDTTAVLLQQAVEKYLKGYLISRGWRLKKTHDLRELIKRATEFDPAFSKYFELARKLTAFYIEERYPSGPPADYPRQDIANMLKRTEKLIDKIKKAIK